MSSTQLLIILQTNNPNQVLSAYLQPSYFGRADPVGGKFFGAKSADCYAFLQGCLIGSCTYTLNDLVMRIPYYTYP